MICLVKKEVEWAGNINISLVVLAGLALFWLGLGKQGTFDWPEISATVVPRWKTWKSIATNFNHFVLVVWRFECEITFSTSSILFLIRKRIRNRITHHHLSAPTISFPYSPKSEENSKPARRWLKVTPTDVKSWINKHSLIHFSLQTWVRDKSSLKLVIVSSPRTPQMSVQIHPHGGHKLPLTSSVR